MRRVLRLIGYAAFVAIATCILAGGAAEAVPVCTQTGLSGGNPGGEPVITCTGVVEGDQLTATVDQTVTGDHLIAQAIITVIDISNGSVLLDIDLTNSSSPGGTANRITVFGLGIDPDATGGSILDIGGNTDTDALTTFSISNFPGFQGVEFCATSGANCAGGGNGGLQSGQEDLFRFSLTGGFVEGDSITLSQFAFKFQGGQASYEKPGGGGGLGSSEIPGPATLLLLGSGLLGLGLAGRVRGLLRK